MQESDFQCEGQIKINSTTETDANYVLNFESPYAPINWEQIELETRSFYVGNNSIYSFAQEPPEPPATTVQHHRENVSYLWHPPYKTVSVEYVNLWNDIQQFFILMCL